MALTNAGRGEPRPITEPPPPRGSYQGLCRCGTSLNVTIALGAESPMWTPIGTVEWSAQHLDRDGLPASVVIDHADCAKPPSRIARERGIR
jgi:hypothetical protein